MIKDTSRKKVLFVIDTLEIGGAEQSLLANTNFFKQVEPIICHIYKGESLKNKFIENGIEVYSLNIHYKYDFFNAYRALKRVVEIEKPHMIVGYITKTEIICRLISYTTKIPVIGTFITDLYASDYNKHLNWKSKSLVQLFKILNRITSKICIGFISNSQTIKEANSKHLNLPLDKIKVINRGRDSNHIKKKDIKLDVSISIKRFLNVGRLIPVKGQKELILSFEKILQKNQNVILHIIGDGPLRYDLQNLINEKRLQKHIVLLGSRNDVIDLLCDYDCFIFPSHLEGFSGSVIESMFAGVPVLASDIGANKEAISHLNTGYLFKTGSIEAIQNAIQWFLENETVAKLYAQNAYNFAKANFELEEKAKQLEIYLIQCIEKMNHEKKY